MYVCMYVCMFVCLNMYKMLTVCMYVCMYVCMFIGESSSSSAFSEPGQYHDMDLPVRSQSLLYRMPTKSFSIGNDFHIMKMYVCMYVYSIQIQKSMYVCI